GEVEGVVWDPERGNGALEYRRVRDVEYVAAFFQEPAGLRCFLAAAVREIDVGPAREPVLSVPGRFAVPQQNELMHGTPEGGTPAAPAARQFVGSPSSCPASAGPESVFCRTHTRSAARPPKRAAAPSSSSIRSSWLYLQIRSVRLADPVLIWPAAVPTARSAIVESSVSPDRCEMIVAYCASAAIFTASSVSVTVPI